MRSQTSIPNILSFIDLPNNISYLFTYLLEPHATLPYIVISVSEESSFNGMYSMIDYLYNYNHDFNML